MTTLPLRLNSDPVECAATAWDMIERAQAGDSLSVGVALDYVMDSLECERDEAKRQLYRHVARTIHAIEKRDSNEEQANVMMCLYLFDDNIKDAKLFMQGYGTKTQWGKRTKRLVKLCSWIASTP